MECSCSMELSSFEGLDSLLDKNLTTMDVQDSGNDSLNVSATLATERPITSVSDTHIESSDTSNENMNNCSVSQNNNNEMNIGNVQTDNKCPELAPCDVSNSGRTLKINLLENNEDDKLSEEEMQNASAIIETSVNDSKTIIDSQNCKILPCNDTQSKEFVLPKCDEEVPFNNIENSPGESNSKCENKSDCRSEEKNYSCNKSGNEGQIGECIAAKGSLINILEKCLMDELITKNSSKITVVKETIPKEDFSKFDTLCTSKFEEVNCKEREIKEADQELFAQPDAAICLAEGLFNDSSFDSNSKLLESKENVLSLSKVMPNDVTSLSLMLSACAIDTTNGDGMFSSKVDLAFSELDMKRLEDIFESHKEEPNTFTDDTIISNSLKELYKNGRGISIDDDSLLGFAHSLTSELEKNLYSNSLGLEDIINAAVNEIGLEFSQDKEFQDQLMSLDSDSNMATASEGIISSCSTSASSEISPHISEVTNNNCSPSFLPEGNQDSNLEGQLTNEGYGKRGDADGCSLSNSDDANFNKVSDAVKVNFSTATGIECQSDNDSGCSCQRPDVIPHEENGSVLMGAWNELRSSLRQLHRSVVPSSLTKSGLSNPRNRPSINRIKALSNMLLAHDPHQLFTRVNQLSQELCIELKVRLLATIHDKPDFDEACTFMQALCESYEWVISVCETIQSAFEKLDTEYLSGFGLNWMTVNMHTFYATIFTDPDVQDYLNLCAAKAEEFSKGQDTMGCLTSLRRTLTVAEGVWCRAERSLQEYAMERAAYNAQRRQLLSEWGQLKSRHNSFNKYTSQASSSMTKYSASQSYSSDLKQDPELAGEGASVVGDNILPKCSCHSCHSNGNKDLPALSNVSSLEKVTVSGEPIGESDPGSGSCECHFCNSTSAQAHPSNGMLASSNASVLPPLTQPQLSLYPHIHGTTVGSDIVSNPCLEDLGPLPGSPAVKPPIFANPYLGSDLLTEQLIREWDLVYGDTLTPPSFSQQLTSTNKGLNINDQSLSNNLDKVNINSRPSYARQMQQPDDQTRKSPTYSLSKNLPPKSNGCDVETATSTLTCQGSASSKSVADIHSPHCSNAAAHLQNCNNANSSISNKDSETSKHRMILRSSERSSSRDSPSDIETTDPDEWSSGDESDASSSSTGHQAAHCDCCYCHMLQNMPGGGRQKYSDRRDRLLKILSHKKKTTCSSASNGLPTSTEGCVAKLQQHKEKDKAMGQQTVDEIMNYIEGRRTSSMCHKKAAKKARQKERKLALKKQEEYSRKKSSSSSSKSSYHREDDFDDEEYDDEMEYYDDESEDLIEEEEDGPLAELRRRAPDVTITVVKPSHQLGSKGLHSQKINSNDPGQGSKHPLVAKPTSVSTSQSNNVWTPPRPTLSNGRLGASGLSMSSNMTTNESTLQSSTSANSGLSSLLKGMDVMGKDQDKDNKGSQMVTIRRIMDPVSSEPTVTITLKGEEPKKDKVLFKLVNGQACQGDNVANSKNQPKQIPKVKKPQEKPVYNIPEGLDPEEVKKLKKKQKKERQKQRKEIEKIEEEKQEQMKQIQLQKQQEYLKQQEVAIKKQQEAIHRQQEELLRMQKKGIKGNKNKDKKGKGADKGSSNGKGKSSAAVVYDKDDVARNFNLPPGVSINKVAGQPGMVTISNTMGNPFTQPFLPNPNMYPNPVVQSYNLGGSQGFPVESSNGSMGYSGIYGGGCGSPRMPWNEAIDPCTGAPQESVIVVDTKTGTTKSNSKFGNCNSMANQNYGKRFKAFDEMTSEDKVEAAVRGEVDVSLLNITQRKKVKKALKALKEEEENAVQKQREEDELMDRMYEMAKGQIPVPSFSSKESKGGKSKGKDSSRTVSAQVSVNSSSSGTSSKSGQQIKAKNKPSNLPSSKTKNSGQKQTDKPNTKLETKINNKSQQEQRKPKPSLKETPKQVNEAQKKTHQKSEIQQKSSPVQTKQNLSKQSSDKRLLPQAKKEQLPQGQLSVQKLHQQSQHAKSQQPQQNQQKLQMQSQLQKPTLQNQQPSAQPKIQDRTPLKTLQNQRNLVPPQNLPKQVQQQAGKQMPQTKSNQEKPPAILKQQAFQQVQKLQLEKTMPTQTPTVANKKLSVEASVKLQGKQESKPVMKAHHALKGPHPCKENGSALSYGPSVGYTATDIGHEARYAQYLAANASTLATVEYETSQMQKGTSPKDQCNDSNQRKGKKRGKRGHLEDMTTIDSVFTPKDGPGGELDDETDREVEAFKRFCLYNVPRNAGEKPKINFNVKDIMIKKKH